MADRLNPQDFRDLKKLQKEFNEELDRQNRNLSQAENTFGNIFSISKRLYQNQREIDSANQKINRILKDREKILNKNVSFHAAQTKSLDKDLAIHQKQLKVLQRKQAMWSTLQGVTNLVKLSTEGFFKYLMEADGTIKSVSLEMGFTANRSEILRNNFYEATQQSAILGARIKDIKEAQMGFVLETGKARALSAEALEDITKIGLGTGLGVQKAAELAGQFDTMGVNVSNTADYVQGVLEVSERMGVNATKVLDNVAKNFKKLQTFTFKQGIKGFAQMASYAEKFRIDMGQMLDSAEKARTLEGAVELAARLQVMGGEFAKTDPFEILFLSRNDPAEFTKKINEMTKGIVTWRENSEGVMEKFISPADRDRLFSVAKALGLQGDELVNQALRMADITRLRTQMGGLGLNKKEMELIEGMAIIGENGVFQIEMGGTLKDVNKLSKDEIGKLEIQKATLEERAKAALTFDRVFANTLESLKASLLPLLDGVNMALETFRPILKAVGNLLTGFDGIGMKIGGILLASVAAFRMVVNPLSRMFIQGGLGKFLTKGGASAVGSTTQSPLSGSQMLGKGKMAAGAGKGAMMRGVGVGAAGLGIGAGIGVAATGISQLAKAIKDVDVEKLQQMNNTLIIMGGTMAALTIGLGVLAATASVGSVGLLALGAAALGVGAGIGIAAAGVGKMAEGFATLDGVDLSGSAVGIAAIAGASLAFLNPITSASAVAMGLAMGNIAKSADGVERVGTGFEKIATVMDGDISRLTEIKNVIASISNIKGSSNNPIAQLTELLSQPLKVEFADKEVAMNLQVDIDGERFIRKQIKPSLVMNGFTNAQKKGVDAIDT